jgi:nucleoside-diphosphate kinase
VRELRLATRADLAGLPLLRDADRACGAGDAARARDAAREAQQHHQRALTVALERSLVLIKPDAVRRRLAGEILGRIEARGFEIREARLVTAGRDLGEEHYAEHREKPFFGELVEFITSGPTWALVVEGEGAIATMRATIGATDPANAAPGTIRGDLASSMPDNLVHGSDSPESAEREIALWFGD